MSPRPAVLLSTALAGLALTGLACSKDADDTAGGDGGAADGGAADGGGADGGGADGGGADGGGADGGGADGGGADGGGADGGGADGGGADGGADGGGDEPLEIPEDNIVNALGDCLGYQREPEAYPNQLGPGAELRRYTIRDPQAVCNDGTPAVLYVRPATDPTLADVWSIHLQGGGGCGSYLGCAIRWCGLQYYDYSKMSSADLPVNVAGYGIFDMDEANALAGANQVFFYYCSSDSWRGIGSASYDSEDIELPEDLEVEIPFELPPYTIFRRGHVILEAGLDELAGGLTADEPEDVEIVMPPLDEATVVVFNGTSAGSTGARTNADWVTERLSANGTEVVAIFDAAHTPIGDAWDATWQSAYEELQDTAWEQLLASESPLPYADESCLAHLGGTEDERLCHRPEYLMWHHITTPFFVRQDLRDTTELSEATGIPEAEHEAAVVTMLEELATLRSTATEGDAMRRTPGAYGPNCSQHVALESTNWWVESTVRDADGVEWSFQDAFAAWYAGADVAIIDAPRTGGADGPRSTCEAIDTEK